MGDENAREERSTGRGTERMRQKSQKRDNQADASVEKKLPGSEDPVEAVHQVIDEELRQG